MARASTGAAAVRGSEHRFSPGGQAAGAWPCIWGDQGGG